MLPSAEAASGRNNAGAKTVDTRTDLLELIGVSEWLSSTAHKDVGVQLFASCSIIFDDGDVQAATADRKVRHRIQAFMLSTDYSSFDTIITSSDLSLEVSM